MRFSQILFVSRAGDAVPKNLPKPGALRKLKSRKNTEKRRHNNTYDALMDLKYDPQYSDCIHYIGHDPFCVVYSHPHQIYMYREFCKKVEHPLVVLDATGSVVKKFQKFTNIFTKTLYLYEVIAYDKEKGLSFPVSNMISESHNTHSITCWLKIWLARDVPVPKISCSDMSLALLSAQVNAFTQYPDLKTYLRVCNLLIKKEKIELPACQIRIDVAHFVKHVSNLDSLKAVVPGAREIYIRAICLIIKAKSISEVEHLLELIFTIAQNEKDGFTEKGEASEVEKSKKKLINLTCTGEISTLGLFQDNNDLMQDSGNDFTSVLTAFKNYDNYLEEIARNIAASVKNVEGGDNINSFFCPNLIRDLIGDMKLLPLWSAIMTSFFEHGGETISSAAVESSFRTTKHLIFRSAELPTYIDVFVQTHLDSREGCMLLMAGEMTNEIIEGCYDEFEQNDENIEYEKNNENFSTTTNGNVDVVEMRKSYNEFHCPECQKGNYPGGGHRCIYCKRPVHIIFLECSKPVDGSDEGYGQKRICWNCSNTEKQNENSNKKINQTNSLNEPCNGSLKKKQPKRIELFAEPNNYKLLNEGTNFPVHENGK